MPPGTGIRGRQAISASSVRPLRRVRRRVVGSVLSSLLTLALIGWRQAGSSPVPERSAFVSPPAGFISFCIRFPDQCEAGAEQATEVFLTATRWQLLQRINADVNRAIRPADDEAHYGRPEYWTIPSDGFGDCEDYALIKRRDLSRAGFPLKALRIAIVTSLQSGRHAVLVVVSDKSEFVLDNLTDAILDRRQSAYFWIERQDAFNPYAWISYDTDGDFPSAAAVGTSR